MRLLYVLIILSLMNSAFAKIEIFRPGYYGYKTGDKVILTIECVNMFGFLQKHELDAIIVGDTVCFVENENRDWFMPNLSIKDAIELYHIRKTK